MTWKVAVQPTTEPITLAEARMHLRLTTDSVDSPAEETHPEDLLVSALVTAARQYAETYLQRALCDQQVEVVLDSFPSNEIALPLSPIVEVLYLTYVDENGDSQTLDPSQYVLDNDQEPGWLLPLIDTTWPTTYGVINAVRIRYRAGYSSPDDSPNDRPIPEVIKRAMLLLVGNWYENREATVIGTIATTLDLAVKEMLKPYQIRMGMA